MSTDRRVVDWGLRWPNISCWEVGGGGGGNEGMGFETEEEDAETTRFEMTCGAT